MTPSSPLPLAQAALVAASIAALASGPAAHDVVGFVKVSNTQGGFSGLLNNNDRFATCIIQIGDLDGDGIQELAAGAKYDDDGGTQGINSETGALWILFMNADRTVRSETKISATSGGFVGPISDGDRFGCSVAPMGDLDGDGIPDIAVGANLDDGGGQTSFADLGAVWLLLLNADGTVKTSTKIADGTNGFPSGLIQTWDRFGTTLASVGDLDLDGIPELAVGALGDDDGGFNLSADLGALYILFLTSTGNVRTVQKISATAGNFRGNLRFRDYFSEGLAPIGDVDGDGIPDLAVSAMQDNDGGRDRGAVYILFLFRSGKVRAHQKISNTQGNFTAPLIDYDYFGGSVAGLGDIDGDGTPDLAVGAIGDDDGGSDQGKVYVLQLHRGGTVKHWAQISENMGGNTPDLDPVDRFGISLAAGGDLNGDGVADLIVGAYRDDDGGLDRGAFYQLFLNRLPVAIPYGCGLNPQGSLTVLAGTPSIGTSITLGVSNPLGTQAIGSLPLVFLSVNPDPAFPCGTLVPNWGMAGNGTSGELLISLNGVVPALPVLVGPAWLGPGSPSAVNIVIPNDPLLAGLLIYSQAVLLDLVAPGGVMVGITEAIELQIAP